MFYCIFLLGIESRKHEIREKISGDIVPEKTRIRKRKSGIKYQLAVNSIQKIMAGAQLYWAPNASG